MVRKGVINIPGEQGGPFGTLWAPDADPSHFWPIPSRPPQKTTTQVNQLHGRNFQQENFLTPPPKKRKILAKQAGAELCQAETSLS